MNWGDERYVRLYTRDTVTWKRWRWETRAVFTLMLRKVDRSGVLDTGAGTLEQKADAVALLLEVPMGVADSAIQQLLDSGTLTESSNGFVLPAFIEAQEAAQSDATRQRESRERRRAANMRNAEVACHEVSRPVTNGHDLSQPVTPAVPSVPSQPSKKRDVETTSAHQETVSRLCATFKSVRGAEYPFAANGKRNGKAVKELLATYGPDAIDAAWRKALTHQGFPRVSTLMELQTQIAHFVGTPSGGDWRSRIDPNAGFWPEGEEPQ